MRTRITWREAATLVCLGALLGTGVAAVVVRPLWPAVTVGGATVVVGVVLVVASTTGMQRLYADDPGAHRTAATSGTTASAVVEHVRTLEQESSTLLVELTVRVAGGDGPYRTRTLEHIDVAHAPAYQPGRRLTVGVHPHQPGVVAVRTDPYDDGLAGPEGARTEHGVAAEHGPVADPRPVVEHSGRPEPAGGALLAAPAARLLAVGCVVLGAALALGAATALAGSAG